MATIDRSSDPTLFTPGPLTTSLSVKQAMLHDAGSWHHDFNAKTAQIREALLRHAGVSREEGYECVPMQGSGTFGVESVFQTCVPDDAKVLVLANGAYGERMALMLKHARMDHEILRCGEDGVHDAAQVSSLLASDPKIAVVSLVHCETTTGILNPLQPIGRAIRQHGRLFFVDAMSSFGAIPIDMKGLNIDLMVSSANKCFEGVPGFSFIIGRREALLANEHATRSLSLDLAGQLRCLEKTGRFRYSPPTHSILAFERALEELEKEGGIEARGRRYEENHKTILRGMNGLGFRSYLPPQLQSFVITSFHYPGDPKFDFETFYQALSDRAKIIYPGKISQVDLFRIGSIGRIFPSDCEALVDTIGRVIDEQGIII